MRINTVIYYRLSSVALQPKKSSIDTTEMVSSAVWILSSVSDPSWWCRTRLIKSLPQCSYQTHKELVDFHTLSCRAWKYLFVFLSWITVKILDNNNNNNKKLLHCRCIYLASNHSWNNFFLRQPRDCIWLSPDSATTDSSWLLLPRLLSPSRERKNFWILWMFVIHQLQCGLFPCNSFSQLPWDVDSMEFCIFNVKRPFCPGSKVLLALLPGCFSFSKLSCLEWTMPTTHFGEGFIFLACSLSPEKTEVWVQSD